MFPMAPGNCTCVPIRAHTHNIVELLWISHLQHYWGAHLPAVRKLNAMSASMGEHNNLLLAITPVPTLLCEGYREKFYMMHIIK